MFGCFFFFFFAQEIKLTPSSSNPATPWWCHHCPTLLGWCSEGCDCPIWFSFIFFLFFLGFDNTVQPYVHQTPAHVNKVCQSINHVEFSRVVEPIAFLFAYFMLLLMCASNGNSKSAFAARQFDANSSSATVQRIQGCPLCLGTCAIFPLEQSAQHSLVILSKEPIICISSFSF